VIDALAAEGDVAKRARRWRDAMLAAVCDVLEPWEYGTIARATRYPRYFSYNLVRVQRQTSMGVQELVALADRALAGLEHRRIDFDLGEAAEPLRAGFESRGWRTLRLLWMHHAGQLPPGPDIAVEEVPYDAVHPLRVAWQQEDFPGVDASGFYAEAREVALRRDPRVLAVRKRGAPVAFAQLEQHAAGAEIAEVFVDSDHRGRGLGTAVTRAAINAAGELRDLWINADDEDRPKNLYARLGFRPACTTMEFLRPPG
jgi:GNAT superfamily N-acetyltransferase